MSDTFDSKDGAASSKEERGTLIPSKHYLVKMENGYYRTLSEDGTEVTGVNLPINICLMALRGELPPFVRVCPSAEDIELEPSLKILRDRYLAELDEIIG